MNKKAPAWLALCVVVVAAIAVLAIGDTLVGGVIEKEEMALANAARLEVFSNADEFVLVEDASAPVDNCYEAKLAGSTTGYVSQVTVNGFAGPIEILLGMDKAGVITGIQVGGDAFAETDGLGSKTREPEFTEQFIGKSNMLLLNEDVDTVVGASTSSGAVVGGVNEAMKYMYGLAGISYTEKEAPKEEVVVAEPVEEGVVLYNAGSYTAEGMGLGGAVPVTVTFTENQITAVEVGANNETVGIGTVAIEKLPELIVLAQNTADVKTVSGATLTSNAIFSAVNDCIKQASVAPVEEAPAEEAPAEEAPAEEAPVEEAPAEEVPTEEAPVEEAPAEGGLYVAGTYEATGMGIGGKVPVKVTFDANAITAIEVGSNMETVGIGSVAIDKLPGRILEAQSTDVKKISGATITSDAIMKAVNTCIEEAMAASGAPAGLSGTYEASAMGLGGKVPVTVTFEAGAITAIEVGSNMETVGIGSVAIDKLPGRIIEAQSLNVKSISGATITSKAILTAVEDCIAQAGGNAEDWKK